MAESPLTTVVRLLGGVVLMQGNLGHQVLGQLLVLNTNEVAVAAAAVVIAATSREKNAVAQIALRTAAPALAARAIIQKQQSRLDKELVLLNDRREELIERESEIGRRERELHVQRGALLAAEAARKSEAATAEIKPAPPPQAAAQPVAQPKARPPRVRRKPSGQKRKKR